MVDARAAGADQAAADAALRAGDLSGAIAAYGVALGRLPPGAEPELRGLLLLGRCMARQLLGDRAALADALAALESWRDARADWVAPALADIAVAAGASDPELADAYWEAAEAIAQGLQHGAAAAVIAGERGRRALEQGDLGTARAQFERCEQLARAAGDDGMTGSALLGLARVDVASGAAQSATRRVAEAMSLALDPEQERAADWLLVDVAHAASARGEVDEAELALDEVLTRAGDEDLELRERALLGLAGLARRRGDAARALELGDDVVELMRRRGDETGLAFVLHDLGVLAAEAGGAYDATAHLNEAFTLARRYRLPPLAASAARMLATIASLRGDHLRALGFAEQAAAFPLAGGERAACAATLAAIGADAERWQRQDVAIPAYAGAAEIYRSLGDGRTAARWEAALQQARERRSVASTQRDSVEAALEVARRLTQTGGPG